MEVSDLALLRFDFVMDEDRGELLRRLEDAFGVPDGSHPDDDLGDDRGSTVFTGDPRQLGFGAGFDSLTVRVLEPIVPVTEVRTLVTAERRDGRGRTAHRRADWEGWERNLESVRTFIPGEAVGTETTVWWIGIDPVPRALIEDPTDFDSVDRSLPTRMDRDLAEVIEISADRGYVVLDEAAILIPGATESAAGKLTGRVVALDLVGDLGVAVSSAGRRLPGAWTALSSLVAIQFWIRAESRRIDAFEDRLDASLSGLDGGGIADDLGRDEATVSALFELQRDWADLEGGFGRGVRTVHRRLWQASVSGAEGSRLRSPTRGSGHGPDVLRTDLDRLDTELERVRSDADRVADRLDATSTLLGTRASLLAARENLALQEAMRGRTSAVSSRDSLAPWVVALVGLIGLVLAADALMSGGLERFVDRLFDEGLAAFTPQVLAGLAVIVMAVVAVVAARHRATIAEFVFRRKA